MAGDVCRLHARRALRVRRSSSWLGLSERLLVPVSVVASGALAVLVAQAASATGCAGPASEQPRDTTRALEAAPSEPPAEAPAQPRATPAATEPAGPRPCARVVVSAVPEGVRVAFGIAPFYEKYVDVGGLPLVSSARVSDRAFAVAADILEHMLSGRPDVRAQLVATRVRVGIMAASEVTTDMPEHSDLNQAFPATDWNARARGLGATRARPLTSVGEENLLQLPGARYTGESILVHEFGHTFFGLGVAALPGGDRLAARLDQAYRNAVAGGFFANTYAGTNAQEYWAEGVQSWFDTNLEADPPNGVHNHVNTREELLAYDPALAALIREVGLPGDGWRPLCVLPP
ncbi:MAG: hypothetical protein H6725_19800 [Sandaracinaceae bacterium]|nr:hypothetical protein [Sandaracinaceae bacterium]